MAELEGFSENLNKGLEGVDFTLPPEELKAKIAEIANGTATISATGLVNKSAELLQKINGAKETSHAANEKLTQLQQFYDDSQLKESELTKNYQESKELYQASSDKKVASVTEEMEGLKGQLRTLLVDAEVSSKLVGFDVSKELMPMVQMSIASQATIVDGKAMIGDQSLSEYMKEWAESPAGKAVRVAPNNSGGDANGGNTQGSQSVDLNKPWSELTLQEKTARLEQKDK